MWVYCSNRIKTAISNFSFILLLLTSEYIYAGTNDLNVVFDQQIRSIAIQAASLNMRLKWKDPVFSPDMPLSWNHMDRFKDSFTLANRTGTIIKDVYYSDGVTCIREVWLDDDRCTFAIRNSLLNKSGQDIFLKALFPLSVVGPQSLVFNKARDVDKWQVLVQDRLKNGRPQTLHVEGTASFEADPFAIFTRDCTDSLLLFVGLLSQTGHCARMNLNFTEKDRSPVLDHLIAECEFDSCLVPDGGERTSQWVIVQTGTNANHLVSEYADRVGNYHGVPRPSANAPSVFCSWYFHGYHYDENLFHQDLKALDHFPFDVFLIDECWSLGKWGDFNAIDTWPSGMKDAAQKIRAKGYIPGIWTCPYLVDFNSQLAKDHPEWLLKNRQGKRVTFYMNQTDHWVLDPTFPGVCDYLEETYRKIAHEWGYRYFKFDFMRSVILPENKSSSSVF